MDATHVTETSSKVETSSILPDGVRADLKWALNCLADAHCNLDYGRDGLVDIDDARADKLSELIVDVAFVIADLERVLNG
jgi:hypothetical protein